MEMSGLKPETDRILEIAIVVTSSDLQIIGQAPVVVVHQSRSVMENMDEWNTATHAKSGLIERVSNSTTDEAEGESLLIEFLSQFIGKGGSPMCGNSICQDRRFLAKWMPLLEKYFHYRNLDVSTLKELAKRWNPNILENMKRHGKHEALADIIESIEELRHYRETFLKIGR
tara:strand:- start:714 stop:1229 length:516 start_codon:yes stop_codon:yes gene_type:complete